MLKRESNAFAWLRHAIEMLAESANPEEFLEHTKMELFHDQVFCFTPKGKLLALPRHARGRARAICGARTAHRRAPVHAREDRLRRRQAERCAAAACADLH